MYQTMEKVSTTNELENLIEQIQLRFANPATFERIETSSYILVFYQDFAGRKVKLQLEKEDCMHFVYINDMRDMVSTNNLLGYLC